MGVSMLVGGDIVIVEYSFLDISAGPWIRRFAPDRRDGCRETNVAVDSQLHESNECVVRSYRRCRALASMGERKKKQ
jgi:hypothetical protein